jgi:hypothetical protein
MVKPPPQGTMYVKIRTTIARQRCPSVHCVFNQWSLPAIFKFDS